MWGALLGAALPMASSFMSGSASAKGAKKQNEMSMRMMKKQMEWQEYMSNTAHQREVADLRAAGLNPILSATGGMGASTPSGSSAPIVNEEGAGVSSALQALTALAESTLAKETAALKKAETEQTEVVTATEIPQRVSLMKGQEASAKAQANNLVVDAQLKGQQTFKVMKEQDQLDALTDLLKKQGINESIRSSILGLDVQSATAVMADLKNQQKISESDFGWWMSVLERFTKSSGVSARDVLPTPAKQVWHSRR